MKTTTSILILVVIMATITSCSFFRTATSDNKVAIARHSVSQSRDSFWNAQMHHWLVQRDTGLRIRSFYSEEPFRLHPDSGLTARSGYFREEVYSNSLREEVSAFEKRARTTAKSHSKDEQQESHHLRESEIRHKSSGSWVPYVLGLLMLVIVLMLFVRIRRRRI